MNVINDHLGITRLTTRVGGKYQILECFLIIKIKQNSYYLFNINFDEQCLPTKYIYFPGLQSREREHK
jgi:hypothetical protein